MYNMCVVNIAVMLYRFIDLLLLLIQIVEIEQPFDKVKNQRRAFIFITYESEEIVEKVVAIPKQTVGGREVSICVMPMRCANDVCVG